MRIARLLPPLLALALLALLAPAAGALSLSTTATGIKNPTVVAFRPGNLNPVIAQRNGVIVSFVKGKVRKLADLTDRVGQQGGERGLLGLAYSPAYKDNGFVFVAYTDAAGDTQIVRFKKGRYDHFLKGSATVLWSIRQPYANHNGGQLAFGPDGLLYVGMGDGGAGGDPGNRAQNPYTLLGKVLRVDVNSTEPYVVPSSNPFTDATAGEPSVWAMGVRNPHFSFDSRTGSLWLVDSSQADNQEINWVPNPAPVLPNFGWSAFDGTAKYKPQPTPGTLISPLTTYGKAYGCAPIAGNVYRGKTIRKLRNMYVFGDACSGRVFSILRKDPKLVDTGLRVPKLAAIGQDGNGELWLISQKGALSTIIP
ncbi:MAG: PQQ-dependent sugar dehydrogenase [Thermoleophilia bacterium]